MNKKTFWPYGIALFLIIMVCFIVLTVVISIQVSPEDDNAYFSTRQNVDKNINNILIDQQKLQDLYNFYVLNNDSSIALNRVINKKTSQKIHLKLGDEFILQIKTTDKNNNIIMPDSIKALITRFATLKDSKDLDLLRNNNIFSANPIILAQGNWKAMIEVDIDNKKAYFEQFIVVDNL